MFAIWTPTCAHPTMSKEPHSGADAPPGPASPTVVLGPLTVSLAGGPGRLTQVCPPGTTDAHCKEPSLLSSSNWPHASQLAKGPQVHSSGSTHVTGWGAPAHSPPGGLVPLTLGCTGWVTVHPFPVTSGRWWHSARPQTSHSGPRLQPRRRLQEGVAPRMEAGAWCAGRLPTPGVAMPVCPGPHSRARQGAAQVGFNP